MMWNTMPTEGRLRLWKNLRTEIQGLSLQEQMEHVARFCETLPEGSRMVDYYTPENWPTPWEILSHGTCCRSAISLLAFYSVSVVNPDLKIEMLLVEGPSAGIFLLPVVEDQYVLNYQKGQVNNIPDIQDEYIVLQKYSQDKIRNIT